MWKKWLLLTVSAALCVGTSCIVSDQLTTLTILPDGSADWVRFQANIRSTEKGDKGAEELRQFVEEFSAQRDADCARLRTVGGEILEARWVRRQEPCATVVVARLPHAKALQDFFTFKDEKGEAVVETCLAQDGNRRRLTLAVRVPPSESPSPAMRPTEAEQRQELANGISATRVAVSGGRILASRGFTVADDRRSALIDPVEMQAHLQAGGGRAELFLEWELAAP